MATAGNVIGTSPGLPAVSVTVTVALAVLSLAVSGVPVMTPVEPSMLSPEGSPVASYEAMSVAVVPGVRASRATPTVSRGGWG